MLRFRSHFPDIRVPPCRPSSYRPPSLTRLRRSDRSSSSASSGRGKRGDRGYRVSLGPPEKGLILGIPRARTRQVRVTRLGDSCDDNGEYEGGRSPPGQDQSSFSNPPDRMLYPRGDSLAGVNERTGAGAGEGKREEKKEPSGKRRRERAKKRLLNSRSGRPGASIPERFVCIAGLGGI